MNHMTHLHFLLAALEQAQLGRGVCAPNPSVGAVAVREGMIIAHGYHHGAGTAHAEQVVLTALGKAASDITLYVTLEPCNHWGRTPPCVDAIIEAGVKHVVYAYADPNPLVALNNTTARLNAKGVDVTWYPVEAIDAFYQSYRHWILTQQPFVTAKLAQSLDGKIADKSGGRVYLSNALCAAFTHEQRLQTDIILTTARTVNADNPLLTARLPERTCAKTIAILDRNGTLNRDALALKHATHCHIFHDSRLSRVEKYPNCTYHPIPVIDETLDLTAVFQQIGLLGYHDVWVEAGGVLFTALHAQQLVHRTYVYIVPAVLGEKALSAYNQSGLFDHPVQRRWQAMDDNMLLQLDWRDTCLPV